MGKLLRLVMRDYDWEPRPGALQSLVLEGAMPKKKSPGGSRNVELR